jgi:dolichol kinase
MNENLLHTFYLGGAFLVLFASAEFFYHAFHVKAEITRKYVHVGTGLLTMLFPPLLGNKWLVLALCGSFLIILLSSLAWNLLPSINAVNRKTRGCILYPIIVYGCYVIYVKYDQFMFYYIPILVLALCDPIAALVGRKWPVGKYKTFGQTKTLSGSVGFFIAAIVTCICLMVGLGVAPVREGIVVSVIIALVTTTAEGLTHNGYDNLTIPASALAVLMLLSGNYAIG